MTGNPRARHRSFHRRGKRPFRAAFSAFWKAALALLAILAIAVACRSFAQESNGSPDGLYAVPDANRVAGAVPDSPSDRSAKEYLKTLDKHSDWLKQDASGAHAPQTAAAKAAQVPFADGNFAAGGASASGRGHLRLPARAWIALLACGGLFAFLAGGWAWWSHSRRLAAGRAALLPLKPQGAAATIGKPEPGLGRRAA